MIKKTPSELSESAFLMNFPFTVDNREPNNVLMNKFSEKYNYERAFSQFMSLYKIVTANALVYILPSEKDLQDLFYVANLGCYLPHLNNNTILLANFQSPPRIGEDYVGQKFFESMRYNVYQSPYYWEGEADLKYIRDNIYVSCYGARTVKESHAWMENNFNMHIIDIETPDPNLYHLDCSFFPLNETQALVVTSSLSKKDIKKLEKVLEVIPVPEKHKYDDWTNIVRIKNKILYSPVNDSHKELEKTLGKLNLEVVPVDMSEFAKSGAALSCMMMHLNYNNR